MQYPAASSLMYEKILFLYKFIQSPKQVGSITPSSKYLAQAMLAPVNWSLIRTIVELGAGTGVFTKGIYQNVPRGCKVAIFEKDNDMRKILTAKYPTFRFCKDAQNLSREIGALGLSKVDCIISGLPFKLFSQDSRDRILDEVEHTLQEDGLFITFQYSLQMKKQLQSRFRNMDICFVPFNIPPAFVYICRK
ncbi:class I SAM-dependent methyltransferase [Desulfotruncus alcoholivorax]|uniref:class I SAM-dependent methyltransferase n=1 Tax=Desulfotruncus alcoholivorax TaxID=265477 RepID=UPI000429D854|nr:methyltransferase [Desulfotruncus alcoholivorax]